MTDLVPYSIIEQIHPDKAGTFSGGSSDGLAGEHLIVEVGPGKASKLVGIKSLNGPGEIVIVEARIGTDYIWPDTVLDVGQFNTTMPYVPLRIGTITPEQPLELFFQTMGYPSVPPTLNLMFIGEDRDLNKKDVAKDQAHRDLRNGMVRLAGINEWLKHQPHDAYRPFFQNVEEMLRHYTESPEDELPESIASFLEPLLHPGRHAADGIVDAFSQVLRDDQEAGLRAAAQVGGVIQRRGLTQKLLELAEDWDPPTKVPDALAKRNIQPKPRLKQQSHQVPSEVKLPMPGQYLQAEHDYLFLGRNIIMKGDRVEVTSDRKVLINGKEVGQV